MSQKYPHATAIRLDAYSVVLAWATLTGCAILWATALLLSRPLMPATIVLFVAFLAVALAHLVLSFSHKCPVCGKHPTVQGFKPVHPAAAGKYLDGWAGVVVGVVVNGSFVCIHCGTEFTINEPRA